MSSQRNPVNNGQARLRTSSITYSYDDQSVSEVDAILPSRRSGRSSKKVRICTMCGRCKGIRMPRYIFIILCIVFVLLILVLALIIILFAVIPAIVRSTIEKAELNFRSVNISGVRADGFRLRGELVLTNTGSIPATIEPPLIIHVNDVGTVTNNEPISISGGSDGTIAALDCPFEISDMDAFTHFTNDLVFKSSVVWHLQAKATIRPISSSFLSYSDIPLDKNVTLGAFNGLNNVSIGAISLTRSNATHIVIDTTITIQNPSIFSIELGRLFFSLQYDSKTIGYVESTRANVTLRSGSNQIPFFGELQKSTEDSYAAITTVIQNFLTGHTSDIAAIAGQNCTSYSIFATGMTGLSLSAKMPPFDQQLIASLSFESMSLVPSTQDKSVILSASIIVAINSPLGVNSPLNIENMDMKVSLVYQNKTVGNLNIFRAEVTKINATHYKSNLTHASLLLDGTGEGYEKFAQDFILANDTNPIHFRISGLVAVYGSFALGDLSVHGIQVDNGVALGGLNGLSDVTVNGISVDGEEGNSLRLSVNTTIGNPGITTVTLRHFTLTMADVATGTTMGHIPVDVLEVHPGNNSVQLRGNLAAQSEADLEAIGKFFSAYLNGATQPVTLYHNQTSAVNATAMDLTVSGLTMTSKLNGIKAKLIQNITVLDFGIEFDPNNVSRVYVTGRMSVAFVLPSNVNMKFKAVETSIDFFIRFNDSTPVGRIQLQHIPVQHNQTTNVLTMSFKKEELIVLNDTAFEEFAANLVLTTNVTISIDGLASAVAEVCLGNLTLIDIPLNDSITLTGYNQFDNGLLKVDSIDIDKSLSNHSLALRVKTEITNPSVVNIINAGRLVLDLCEMLNGTSLGTVEIDPFFLLPKDNETIITAAGIFNMTESNTKFSREFISNMTSGIDNYVELRGTLEDNSTGTSIPLMKLAIAGLRIHTVVHGLSGSTALLQQLIVKRLTTVEMAEIAAGKLKVLLARVKVINPFNANLTIRSINVTVDYGATLNNDSQIGYVRSHDPLYIGPYEEITSPYVNVTIAAKLATLVSMLVPLIDGRARMSLTGVITITMGDDFELNELPVTMLNISAQQEPKYYH